MQDPASRRSRGFALLIAVTLVAFAALLLLGLATLTRVETAVAAATLREAQARRNALLALRLALGQLQRHAGPDRRATARADLISASVANPFWTGVWDASPASSGPLTWLVSGNEIEPLAAVPIEPAAADPSPLNESVWLLRACAGSASQRIKLVRQPLRAAGLPGRTGAAVTGHYAWWVGDEGTKARCNLVNAYAGEAAGSAGNREAWTSAQQCAIEKIEGGFAAYAEAKAPTPAGAAMRERLGRVVAPNQFPAVDSSFKLADLRDRVHDLTTFSLGVLADTRSGGLRLDLSRGLEAGSTGPSGAVFPGGPEWDLLRSFYQLRPAVGGPASLPPRPHAPPRHGIHPVVVLAQMVWGGDRSGENFRLLLQPSVVLGNPYAVALEAADYRLVWRQSGAVELRQPAGAAAPAASVAGAPAELLGGEPRLLIRSAAFLPGEARRFTLPAAGPAAYPTDGDMVLEAGGADGWAFRDLAASADLAAATMEVRVGAGPAGFALSLAEGGALQEISEGAGAAVEASGPPPVAGAPVRIGLRLSEDAANAADDSSGLRWIADFNLRAPAIGGLPAWGRNPLYGPATPPGGDDGMVLESAHAFWGPSHSEALGGRRFAALFQVPCADLHSLGQLQHANLRPGGLGSAYTAGTGYADPHTPDGEPDFVHQLNEALWDRYFFSTVPAGSGEPLPAPSNQRIVLWRPRGVPPPAAGVRDLRAAAAHLLVAGAFNVNSTSVAAWQAVLASCNGQGLAWSDPATGQAGEAVAGSALLRGPVATGPADEGWRGWRALSDAQIGVLAAAIVERVRARGPFRSLADFVNRPLAAEREEARLRGLLQDALDATVNPPESLAPAAGLAAAVGPAPALAWPAASQGHPSTLAPGWISQADVLGVLGPVLAARSDTFLVRAYGDQTNPATGAVEGLAWCEAVVQRVPEYVDPADPPEAAAGLRPLNTACGRRFRIVHFRWLAPEEV